MWVASTTLYAIFPLLGFIGMGLHWVPGIDGRLLGYDFDVIELATFGWRYVVYLGSFVVVYLLGRGRKSALSARLRPIPEQLIIALLIALVCQYAVKWGVNLGYGLNYDISYSELDEHLRQAKSMPSMPYLMLQIVDIVLASILLTKQAMLVVLVQRWSSLKWRAVLLVWLTVEVSVIAIRLGGRGPAVLLLLSFAVLYHRLVRPLRPLWAVVGGVALMTGFLAHGIVRGGDQSLKNVNLTSVFTNSNEFQSLFTTAYDIYKRKQMGILPHVPWQVYAIDLYLEIPSQILPFEKVDPAFWYLDVLGLRDSGVGFMFGVMAQAVLGFDWIELVLRGALLGVLFAAFHRWYVRRSQKFWVTLLYLFVSIWSYYTFRATSFWFVHYVVYQFIPVMLSVRIIAYALSRWPLGAGIIRVPRRVPS